MYFSARRSRIKLFFTEINLNFLTTIYKINNLFKNQSINTQVMSK